MPPHRGPASATTRPHARRSASGAEAGSRVCRCWRWELWQPRCRGQGPARPQLLPQVGMPFRARLFHLGSNGVASVECTGCQGVDSEVGMLRGSRTHPRAGCLPAKRAQLCGGPRCAWVNGLQREESSKAEASRASASPGDLPGRGHTWPGEAGKASSSCGAGPEGTCVWKG